MAKKQQKKYPTKNIAYAYDRFIISNVTGAFFIMIIRNILIVFFACLCAASSVQASSKLIRTESHELAVKGESYEQKLFLNGTVIFEDPDMMFLTIEAAFPDTLASGNSYYLIQTSLGANVCPAYYRFLTVLKDGSTALSDSFGTCNYFSDIGYSQKDQKEQVTVSMPDMESKKMVGYIYTGGKTVTEKKY